MNHGHQDFVARLGRLERSNRRLKMALGTCCVGVLAVAYLGAAPTPDKIIKAESIQLVDADGRLRAALGSDKDGSFFFMNDQNGKMRASIAAQSVGSYMNLKDDAGTTRVIMSHDQEGPAVRLRDANSLAVLTWDKDGPVLHLQREDGRSRFLTPTNDAVVDPQPEPEQPAAQPARPSTGQPAQPIGPRR
jgi:hypothetical protein